MKNFIESLKNVVKWRGEASSWSIWGRQFRHIIRFEKGEFWDEIDKYSKEGALFPGRFSVIWIEEGVKISSHQN